AIDDAILVLFTRFDVLGRGRAAAKARVEAASRLPRVAQSRSRRRIADLRNYTTDSGETSDAVNENDRRQDTMSIRQINARKYIGKFREEWTDVAADIDQSDHWLKFREVVKHRERCSNVSKVAPIVRGNHRNLGDRLARRHRAVCDRTTGGELLVCG